MNDKPTKNKNNYNEEFLKALMKKYGYGVDYVRKSLRDDKKGTMPDAIKKDYSLLLNQEKKMIDNFLKNSSN